MRMTARPRQASACLLEVSAKLWHLTNEPRWRDAADGLIRAFSGAPEGIGGSPLLLLGADMLERGGCVVVEGRSTTRWRRRLRWSPGAPRTRRLRSCALTAASGRGPAARRPAEVGIARRHAVPGPNLQPAGRDAGGAGGAAQGACGGTALTLPMHF